MWLKWMKYCKANVFSLKAGLNLGQSLQRPKIGDIVGNLGFCVSYYVESSVLFSLFTHQPPISQVGKMALWPFLITENLIPSLAKNQQNQHK